MPGEKILVCGAGVAGSIAAFWLAKHGFQVVVIERSKAEQKAGQGVEIEEPALSVIRAMGILDKLNKKKTGEQGFELLDEQARSCGVLEVGRASFTGNLELMRGDLTEVLYKSADEFPNVTYHFETTIHSLKQTQNKVIVDLEKRNDKSINTEEFDLVIGADGVRSRTRHLVMGPPEELNCLKRVGAFVAYFSIPKDDQDWPYSRACHFPDRRVLWMRPVGQESKTTSVYLIHVKDDIPSLRQANAAGDRMKQKEAFAQLFSGLGWATSRVTEQMMMAENFYSDELVQVKLPKWSRDRGVLVGDAAWAPTVFTGEGNQLAIIGAWVLAQELSRNRNASAFEMYEKRLRSYVEDAQNIPLGGYAPYIFCPQTSWGIWLFQTVFFLLSWTINLSIWTKLGQVLPNRPSSNQDHQTHPAFDLQIEESFLEKVK